VSFDTLVSIVIPAYGARDDLRRSIASVLAQTHGHWELLVVDDGSPDDTVAATVAEFADPRMATLRHPVNRGAAAARNTGVGQAKGEYIAFLDMDDEWHPNKLERQLQFVAAAPDGRAVTSTAFLLRRDHVAKPELRRFPPVMEKDDFVYGCGISPGSTLMMHRAVFNEIGPLDERLRRLEDWDWILRATNKYVVAVLDDPLATIYVKRKNIYPSVAESLAAIAGRRAQYELHGFNRARLFTSAIHHELAGSAYNSGRYIFSVWNMMISIVLAPFKGAALYGNIMRRLWQDGVAWLSGPPKS
jgi:glycosyltransferase involved in cell wall biosynthesis